MITQSVPIMVDAIKIFEEVAMTRCSYFSIETDSPSPNWQLSLNGPAIPFFLLGLSGIIIKPTANETFDSPDSIGYLFDLIEDNPSLYVDINEIWLPTFLFPNEVQRGNVYRVEYSLFSFALQFQNKQFSLDEYRQHTSNLNSYISFSESETIAFRIWENRLINEAIEKYPKNKKLKLSWKESSGSDII